MQKIKFSENVPVQVALAYLEGKPVKSRLGGPEVMFTTTDDQVFYVPVEVATEIERRFAELGVRTGERILIAKERNLVRAVKDGAVVMKPVIRWQVYKVHTPIGEQADGSFVVPAQPGATRSPVPDPAGRQLELLARSYAVRVLEALERDLASLPPVTLQLIRRHEIEACKAAYLAGAREAFKAGR